MGKIINKYLITKNIINTGAKGYIYFDQTRMEGGGATVKVWRKPKGGRQVKMFRNY
jgi:hypothetical protein